MYRYRYSIKGAMYVWWISSLKPPPGSPLTLGSHSLEKEGGGRKKWKNEHRMNTCWHLRLQNAKKISQKCKSWEGNDCKRRSNRFALFLFCPSSEVQTMDRSFARVRHSGTNGISPALPYYAHTPPITKQEQTLIEDLRHGYEYRGKENFEVIFIIIQSLLNNNNNNNNNNSSNNNNNNNNSRSSPRPARLCRR